MTETLISGVQRTSSRNVERRAMANAPSRRSTARAACAGALIVAILVAPGPDAALAQDMIQYLDLKSDDFTKADMTRGDIEAALAAAGPSGIVDLTGKRLNGLDLSGLDLRRVRLQAARLNGARLAGTNLEGVTLDQAWLLKANLEGARLAGASLFATQLMDARLDAADLSKARITADMSRASLRNARFDGADLAADMRNQSMGLMRGVLKSATLDGASFANANLSRVVLEFASLRNVSFKGAVLVGAELAGADLGGADVTGANFLDADVNSARLIGLIGRDRAVNLEKARNMDRAVRD